MPTLFVDKRDQLFVLNEMLKIHKLCDFSTFSDHSGFDMVLNEAHLFAKKEFAPIIEEGDQEGCEYNPKTGGVKFPESYKKPYEKFREGGWLSMCDSPEVGGDGFPLTVGTAVSEIFYAAGFYIYGAAELSHAGAKVIEKYGTENQKDLYMSRLFSGEWMGTMCLTEPDAGSDVGQIQTVAVPKGDGTYSISGTKIFITAGEHDLTENIIHMVLARVEDDPRGTKGLSLFIVPKYLSDENGRLGDFNDVVCTGVEKKMGLHGLVTCTMSYGDTGKCTGYLLGEQGKGIVEMFNMMNEQRLLVGLQGLSYSSSAFLHAVQYTKNRKQGKSVLPEQINQDTQVPIIEHPDVKRMLLTMKGQVDGGRALAYFTSLCIDYAYVEKGEEKKIWKGLVDLLTPVVKAYLTGNSWEMTGMAIQCAGGYGYCSEYPFERLARDCRVSSLYEGTNGIQAIDLMIRKLLNDKRANFMNLMRKMDDTINEAAANRELKSYADTVSSVKDRLVLALDDLFNRAKSTNNLVLYEKASLFLDTFGDVILGWLHLWQMTIVYEKLEEMGERQTVIQSGGKKKDGAFYFGKMASAKFYISTVLAITKGKIEALNADSDPVLNSFQKSFTS